MAFRPFAPSWASSAPAAPKATPGPTATTATFVRGSAEEKLGNRLAATAPGVNRNHFIVLQTVNSSPRLTVAVIVAGDTPTITDGGGGWDTIDRPGRTGLTWWRGRNPLAYEIPVIFDALWTNNGSMIEDDIADLELMWGRGIPPGKKWSIQPPAVGIWSPGGIIPMAYRSFDDHNPGGPLWVVNDIAYGAAIRNDAGNRIRQEATISLLQLVQSSVQGKSAVTNRNRVSYVIYRVTAADVKGNGNPLRRIAKKRLGREDRWKEIKDEKGHTIRDPSRRVKKGDRLKVPSK